MSLSAAAILATLADHLEAVAVSRQAHEEPEASRVALVTLRTHRALFDVQVRDVRAAIADLAPKLK